ncbi:MAG: hypothetical protein ACXWCZ_02520 [Flavisolibacter sp.]
MKKRLLALTCPVPFPFNALSTEPPVYIQPKNNSVLSTNCADACTCAKVIRPSRQVKKGPEIINDYYTILSGVFAKN